MTGSFRAVLKDTFVYGIGDVLIRGTAFLTVPIYTRLLAPDEYGRWTFVLASVAVVSGMLALGGDSAYARYFFEAKDAEGRRLVTTTWLSFLAAWSVLVVLVAIPFSGSFSDWSFDTDTYAILFALALAAAPLTLMSSMLGQALRNEFRAKAYTVVNVGSTLLVIGLGVAGALIAARPLVGILAGGLIGTAVSLPVRIWLVRHLFGRRFSPTLLRRLLAFGVPLVPASLSWWVISTSDMIVLGKLSTLSEAGLYAVALGIASVLALFVTALGLAWSPHALQAYEERREDAPAFFGRMATYIVVGFGALSVLVATFAREALMVLSTPTFYGAALAVGPLALGFVASAAMQVTSAGISLRKKTYWFLVFSTAAAALNLGLNILLVPHWGMLASAWAACASYMFLTVGYALIGQRLWAIEYQYRRLLTAALLTFGFIVGVRLLPDLTLAASIVMKAGYALAYVALLVVLKVVGPKELAAIGTLVRRRPSPRPA